MKKSLYLLIFLSLLSQSQWVYSSQPLSRKLVDSFFITAEKMDIMEQNHPEIMKRADKFKPSEDKKLINYLKSSRAYPEIKSILATSKFKNLKEFFTVSERIIGSMFTIQMKKMPDGMSLDGVEKAFESSINMMEKNGAPADTIKNMKKDLAQQKLDNARMKSAMKRATAADKKFVTDNMQWLMKRFPDADTIENKDY